MLAIVFKAKNFKKIFPVNFYMSQCYVDRSLVCGAGLDEQLRE